MPIHRPPRREPRVLALARSRSGVLFASVDPWEIRSTGRVAASSTGLGRVVARLVRQEKPSAITTASRVLERRLAEAKTIAIPVVRPAERISPEIAAELYPDLARMAPGRTHARLCQLAVALVLEGNLPTRPYAHRRR